MGALPREFGLLMVAFAVLMAGVVLLTTGSTTAGWAVIGVGLVLDTVGVLAIVRRAARRGRTDTPPAQPTPPAQRTQGPTHAPSEGPIPGMIDRR